MILDVPSPSLCDRRAGPLCGSGCVCFGSALLFHHETRGSSIDVFLSGGARPSPWDTFTPLHENELPFRCGRESRKSRFRRGVGLHNSIIVRAGRAVVRLIKIHVRAAWMLYPNKLGVESRSLQDATIGELVLWDVVSCRLS